MRALCVFHVLAARAPAARAFVPWARPVIRASVLAFLATIGTAIIGMQPAYAQVAPPCTQEYWCGMGLYPSAALQAEGAREAASMMEVQDALNGHTLDATPQTHDATRDFDQQTLVFQSLRDGNWEIYRSRLDGVDVTRLTTNEFVDSDPRLSPTMEHIAFVSDRDAPGIPNLYVMNLDGSNVRRLTWDWGAVGPRWTRDGAFLYYTAYNRDGAGNVVDYDIKRVRVADGAVQTIVGGSTIDFDVALKADDSEIVWVRPVSGENGMLMRSRLDGSFAYGYGPEYRFLGKPAWSPTGILLSFEHATAEGWNSLSAHFYCEATVCDGTTHSIVPLLIGGVRSSGTAAVEYAGSSWTHSYYSTADFKQFDDRLLYTEYLYFIVSGNQLMTRRMALAQYDEMGGGIRDEAPRLSDTLLDSSPNARWSDTLPPAAAIYPLLQFTQFSPLQHTLRWLNQDAGGSGVLRAEVQLSASPCCNWNYSLSADVSDPPYLCIYNDFQPQPAYQLNPPYYRLRMVDRALNASAWTPPVTTICYGNMLRTLVTDVRGLPIAGVRHSTNDATSGGFPDIFASGQDGVALAYAWYGFDSAPLNVSHPVYGTTGAGRFWDLAGNWGQSTTYFVSPAGPNLIKDGGFDAELDSSPWQWQGGSPSLDFYSGSSAHIRGSEETPTAGTVSQSIAASAEWENMLNPTLVFVWRFASSALVPAEGNGSTDDLAMQPASIAEIADVTADGDPYFEVIIRDTFTLSETVVLRHNGELSDWRINWVDMTPWKGKPVEVIFALRNPGGIAQERFAAIDNVSLSPWRTPVVSAATPTAITMPISATLAISASNLIGTPGVQLLRSTAAASGVPVAAQGDSAYLEEITLDPATVIRYGNTLTATLPANLAPGVYNILVINPGGDRSFAPQTLIVGEAYYLPRIAK